MERYSKSFYSYLMLAFIICQGCAKQTPSDMYQCDHGEYSRDGKPNCTACPMRTYQPFYGKNFCYPCSKGYTSPPGSSSCYKISGGLGGLFGQTDQSQMKRDQYEEIVLTDQYGLFTTPNYPSSYNTTSHLQFVLPCKPRSFAYVILLDVSLRTGDEFRIGNTLLVVGKWPFSYGTQESKGMLNMTLVMLGSDSPNDTYTGVRGAYACVEEQWYNSNGWPNYTSLLFENQYSLGILKNNTDLLKKFLAVLDDHEKWMDIYIEEDTRQHVFGIMRNVLRSNDLVFGDKFLFDLP